MSVFVRLILVNRVLVESASGTESTSSPPRIARIVSAIDCTRAPAALSVDSVSRKSHGAAGDAESTPASVSVADEWRALNAGVGVDCCANIYPKAATASMYIRMRLNGAGCSFTLERQN